MKHLLLPLVLLLLSGAAHALRAAPAAVDFSLQSVCAASRRLVVFSNDEDAASVRVEAVTTYPSSDFYALSIKPTDLAPGGSLHVNVVLIARSLGQLRGNLTLKLEGGLPDVVVPLSAIGISNPFRVAAVDVRIPVGRPYAHVISIFNPSTRVESLRDAFALEAPFLQLEVPTGYANVTSPPGTLPHTLQLVATGWAPLAASPGGPHALVPQHHAPPQPPPPSWRIPPGASAEVVRVTIRPTQAATVEAHLHLQLGGLGELIVPLSFTALAGGIVPHPARLDLGLIINSHGMIGAAAAGSPHYLGHHAARMSNRPMSFWGIGGAPVVRSWCVNDTAAGAGPAADSSRGLASPLGYLLCSARRPPLGAPAAAVAASERDPSLRLPGGGVQRSVPALWHLYGSAPGWLAAAGPAQPRPLPSNRTAAPLPPQPALLVPVDVAAKAQRAGYRSAHAAASSNGTAGADAVLRRFAWGGGGGSAGCSAAAWALLPPNALASPNFPESGGGLQSQSQQQQQSVGLFGGGGGSGRGGGGLIGMAHGHAVRDAGLYSAAYGASVAVHSRQARALRRGSGSSSGGGLSGGAEAEGGLLASAALSGGVDLPQTPQHGPYRSISMTNVGRAAATFTHAYAAVTGSHWHVMNALETRVAAVVAAQQAAEAHAAAAKPSRRHRQHAKGGGSRQRHNRALATTPAPAAVAPLAPVWDDAHRANATAALASGFLQSLTHEWFAQTERRRASVSLPAGVVLHGDLYLKELGAGRTAMMAAALHAQLFAPLFAAPQLYGPVHGAGKGGALPPHHPLEPGAGMQLPVLLNGSLWVRTSDEAHTMGRVEVPVSAGVLHGGLAYAIEDTLFSPQGGGGGGGGDSFSCVPLGEFSLDLRSRLLTTLPPVTLAALTGAMGDVAPTGAPRVDSAVARATLLPLWQAAARVHAAIARAASQGEEEGARARPGDDAAAIAAPPCIPAEVRSVTLHSGFARAIMASPIFVAHPALHVLRPDVASLASQERLTVTVARHRAGRGGGAAPGSAVRSVMGALAAVADVLRELHSPPAAAATRTATTVGTAGAALHGDVARAAGALAAISQDVLALAAAYLVRFGAAGGLEGTRNVMLQPAREFVGSAAATALAQTATVWVWQFGDGGGASFDGAPSQQRQPWVAPTAAGRSNCSTVNNRSFIPPHPSRRLGAYLREMAARGLRHDQSVVSVVAIGHGLHGDCAALAANESLLGAGHPSTEAFAGELLGCAALAFERSPSSAHRPWLRSWRRAVGGNATPAPRVASDGQGADERGGADNASVAASLRRAFAAASDALRKIEEPTSPGAPQAAPTPASLMTTDRVLDALGAIVMDVIDTLVIHALATTTAGDNSTAGVGYTAPLTVLTDVGSFGIPLVVPASTTPSLAAIVQPLPWITFPGSLPAELLVPAGPVDSETAVDAGGVVSKRQVGSSGLNASLRLARLHGVQLDDDSLLLPVQIVDESAPRARQAGGAPVVQLDAVLPQAASFGQATAVIDVVNREAVPLFLVGFEAAPAAARVASVWLVMPSAAEQQLQPSMLVLPPASSLTVIVTLQLPGGGVPVNASGALVFSARRTRDPSPAGDSRYSVNIRGEASAAGHPLHIEGGVVPPSLSSDVDQAARAGTHRPTDAVLSPVLPAQAVAWASLVSHCAVAELEPIALGGTRSGRVRLHNHHATDPLVVTSVSAIPGPGMSSFVTLLLARNVSFPLVIPPNGSAAIGTLRFSLSALCKACGTAEDTCLERTARHLGFEAPHLTETATAYWRHVAASGRAWLLAAVHVETVPAAVGGRFASGGGGVDLPPLAVIVPLLPHSLLDLGAPLTRESMAAGPPPVVINLPPMPGVLDAFTGGDGAMRMRARPASSSSPQWLYLPVVNHGALPARVALWHSRECGHQWGAFARDAAAVMYDAPLTSNVSRLAAGCHENVALHTCSGSSSSSSSSSRRVWPNGLQWAPVPVPTVYVPTTAALNRLPHAAAHVDSVARGALRDNQCAAFATVEDFSLCKDLPLGALSAISSGSCPVVVVLPPRGGRALLGPVAFWPGYVSLTPSRPGLAPADALESTLAVRPSVVAFSVQLLLFNNFSSAEVVTIHASLALPSIRVGVVTGATRVDWLVPSTAATPFEMDAHAWLHAATTSTVAVASIEGWHPAAAAACSLAQALAGACASDEREVPLVVTSQLQLHAWLPDAEAELTVLHDRPGEQPSEALGCHLDNRTCSERHVPPVGARSSRGGAVVSPVDAAATLHSTSPAFQHSLVVDLSASLSLAHARARCQALRYPPGAAWESLRSAVAASLEAPPAVAALVRLVLPSEWVDLAAAPSLRVNQTLLLSGAATGTIPVRITVAQEHAAGAVLDHALQQAGVCSRLLLAPTPSQGLAPAWRAASVLLALVLVLGFAMRSFSQQPAGSTVTAVSTAAVSQSIASHHPRAGAAANPAAAAAALAASKAATAGSQQRAADRSSAAAAAAPSPVAADRGTAAAEPSPPVARAQAASASPTAAATLASPRAHPATPRAASAPAAGGEAAAPSADAILACLQSHPSMTYTAAVAHLLRTSPAAATSAAAAAGHGVHLRLPEASVRAPQAVPKAGPHFASTPSTVSLLEAQRSIASALSSSASLLSLLHAGPSQRTSNASEVIPDDWEAAPGRGQPKRGGAPLGGANTHTHPLMRLAAASAGQHRAGPASARSAAVAASSFLSAVASAKLPTPPSLPPASAPQHRPQSRAAAEPVATHATPTAAQRSRQQPTLPLEGGARKWRGPPPPPLLAAAAVEAPPAAAAAAPPHHPPPHQPRPLRPPPAVAAPASVRPPQAPIPADDAIEVLLAVRASLLRSAARGRARDDAAAAAAATGGAAGATSGQQQPQRQQRQQQLQPPARAAAPPPAAVATTATSSPSPLAHGIAMLAWNDDDFGDDDFGGGLNAAAPSFTPAAVGGGEEHAREEERGEYPSLRYLTEGQRGDAAAGARGEYAAPSLAYSPFDDAAAPRVVAPRHHLAAAASAAAVTGGGDAAHHLHAHPLAGSLWAPFSSSFPAPSAGAPASPRASRGASAAAAVDGGALSPVVEGDPFATPARSSVALLLPPTSSLRASASVSSLFGLARRNSSRYSSFMEVTGGDDDVAASGGGGYDGGDDDNDAILLPGGISWPASPLVPPRR